MFTTMAIAIAAIAADVHGGPPLGLPGPAPQLRAPGADAAAENIACEGCHEDIAGEWRASMHHRSWDDGVFQAAYVIEPLPFCRSCHVPEADPSYLPSAPLRRLGIGCVTCHVQGKDIVGVRVRARAHDGLTHAVRADTRLATGAACERCHEFEFPRPQRAPMQGTASEHRASPYAETACQSCHMPLVRSAGGRSHRSHDFRVISDATLLRSAVTARAARATDRAITVTLAASRVGHAFPTGDMFRRLEARARVLGDLGAAAQPVVLARRFVVLHGAQGVERREIGDDRLPGSGEPREVSLRFADVIGDRAVRWEVVYQRMAPRMASLFGVDPRADEVVVAEGTLAPTKSRR